MQASAKTTLAAAVLVAGIAALLVVPSAASAANTASNNRYEIDNGTQWTLQRNTAAGHSTFTTSGYADAGVVVDLGPLSNLSGINVSGTGVSDNLWIGDGSEAYTPGTHNLSDAVDFAYGFDNHDGTFWMASDPTGTYRYQNATLGQLSAEYPAAEAYAWVGVTYGGSSVSGSLSAINGHSVGNRSFSFTNNSDGSVTAAIH